MKYNPSSLADRIDLAKQLQALFERSGFKKIESSGEDVYAYEFPLMPRTRILVYSTIVHGCVRGDGADAIRVAGVYTRQDGQVRGIVSDTRVNRTGDIEGIVARTRERMRGVYAELRDRSTNKLCKKCNAPLFISKQGNEVCAETCWLKKDNHGKRSNCN